jgi:hypothetical protein
LAGFLLAQAVSAETIFAFGPILGELSLAGKFPFLAETAMVYGASDSSRIQ